jgi:uncharacterized protein YciI
VPRDPDITDAFDVYTLVVLRPADAPAMSDEQLDALQPRHLAYRAELKRQGVTVANGPFDERSDVTMRGRNLRLATAIRRSALASSPMTSLSGADDPRSLVNVCSLLPKQDRISPH